MNTQKDPHKNFVNLIFKCNNNCVSCIMEHHYMDDKKLNLDSIKNLIKEILAKSSHIEFNGGEPTLNKDLFEILKFVKQEKKSAEVGIISNIRIFSQRNNVEKLAKLNLKNLKIMTTLYGPNEKIHDAVTRTPNSFRQQVDGIKNLIANKIKIELRIVVNKINYLHLGKIAEFITINFSNSDFIHVNFINTKLIGQALKNIGLVGIKSGKIIPHLVEAVNILEEKKFKVRLSHFPHCILPKNMHALSTGMSAEKSEVTFRQQCDCCSKKHACSGIWKSYADNFGSEEFKPIR